MICWLHAHCSRGMHLSVLVVILFSSTACSLAVTGTSLPPTATSGSAPPFICPQQAYCAPVPGPQCDHAGAQWASVPGNDQSITCTAQGLHLSVQAGQEGAVGFQPSGGMFAESFVIAVTIDLADAPDGCGTIETDTNQNIGAGNICTGGGWLLSTTPQHATAMSLAQGQVQPGSAYRLMMTFDRSHATLSINGVQVGQTRQITAAGIDLVALGLFNTGTTTESATFRDFVYSVSR